MGIIKECNFWPGAYHKITGVEINVVSQKLVVRTTVYPNKDNRDISTGIEYRIKPATFTGLMRAKAEPLVDSGAIRTQIETEGKKNKWSKSDIDSAVTNQIEIAIVNKMAELGEQEMQKCFVELNKKSAIKTSYDVLKKLPEFNGAIDA